MAHLPDRPAAYIPKHERNGRWGWTRSIGQWFGVLAVTGGIAAWEAVRIADARATVVSGWAAGIVAGVGSCLALPALVAVTALAQRQRPWSRGRRRVVPILLLTIALLLSFAFLISTPGRQFGRHPVPHVITAGAEVGEIAYVGTFFAGFAVAMVALLVPLIRGSATRRRTSTGPRHRPPARPGTTA